jgi:lysophospholipase L1-like esterase
MHFILSTGRFQVRTALAGAILLAGNLSAAPVLIDFGPNDVTNGNITTSPDTNGNHWNNQTGPTLNDLVDSTGAATTVDVDFTTNFITNGILNGGLLAPSPALLGTFAVNTATQDYFFTTTSLGFKLKQLNPSKVYDIRFFGTRESTSTRITRYSATGLHGTLSADLQTSGTAIGDGGYNGNNNSLALIQRVAPDSANEITIEVIAQSGGFGYIGAMEISEVAENEAVTRWSVQDQLDPPAPGSVLFVGSSSIRRWESLTRDFADYHVLQRGFGGSQFEELNAVVDRIVIPYQPSAIVLWEGTNDINTGETGAEVFADFQSFLDLVKPALPDTQIFYLGITRTPGTTGDVPKTTERLAANSLISSHIASSGDPKLHYIDLPAYFESLPPAEFDALYVDSLHLNRAGYAVWKSIIRPAIEAVVPPNKTFTPNADTMGAGERLLFDFGPTSPADGDHTLGADANGKLWNNWHRATGGAAINAGEHLANLVDTTGAGTGIRMTIIGGFSSNGKANGGLLTPSPLLLGDFAVATATQDYFFSTADDLVGGGSDDIPGGFMLDGLDPNQVYDFRFFGSRFLTVETRVTEFRMIGANSVTVNHTTSGNNIGSDGVYDGNDNTIAVARGVRPDAFGQVFVDLTVKAGGFAYVNAMEVAVGKSIQVNSIQHDGSNVSLQWTSSGLTDGADIYRSIDLSDWGSPIGVGITNSVFVDPTPPPGRGFYKVVPAGWNP